jgi:amino acid adenylation domain-containing protein
MRSSNLPPEQAAIQAKCFHPSGEFAEFPKAEIEQSIPERFDKMVRQSPNRIAVKARDQSLTYAELNSKANRLAHTILARRGAGEEPIALLLAKGAPLVIAVFGVLKAGKMYVLLDPAQPTARNRFILDHARASVIITDTERLDLASELVRQGEHVISVVEAGSGSDSENPALAIPPETIAWIHYTSGSTGEPKGVIQTHRNALYKVMHDTNDYHVCARDRLTFPASRGGDMFLALLNGASVFPIEIKEAGFPRLAEHLYRDEITILTSVTSTFRHFVNSFTGDKKFWSLRLIRLIGEPLYKHDVDLFKKHFLPPCILLNRLGSNETGSFCQYFIDHSTPIADGVVPVGYPVEGKDVLLLDDDGKDVGVNQVGEFAVRNSHLAVGYWRNPELTQTAFQSDPAGGENRIYRVGDLGRRLPNGCFLHLGRKDFQVKIRGNRVEIAEVEAALLSCRHIKEAVVVGNEDSSGDKRLIAYFVPDGAPFPTAAEIRAALTMKLPSYMIPSAFVALDKFPLIGIGKVDRAALPPPDGKRPALDIPYVPPRTSVEVEVSRIWADALKIETVGINDNFFDLGGHSLLAINVIARLRKKFGVDLPVRTLFEAPTIAQLAARLETQTQPVVSSNGKFTYSHLIELRNGPNQKPIFCFPYRCGVQGEYTHFLRLAQYMTEYSFYGLQAKAAQSQTPLQATIEELAAEYVREIEEFQPNGPYYLIGDCLGRMEAYETARQLSVRGRKVGLLMLLDAQGPYLAERYWRIGSYSIKNLDRLRRRLLRSRLGNLATATSFHWEESKKLTNGKRWSYLAAKALKKIRDCRWLLEESSAAWSQEPEAALSASEEELLKCVNRARRKYRSNWPSDYRGRIVVIINKQWYGFDRTFGWAGMAGGGIERHAIPGDHISYMLEDVPLVADRLRACLEKAQKEM